MTTETAVTPVSDVSEDFVVDFFAHVDAHDFDWVEQILHPECVIEAPGFQQKGPEMVTIWMAGFFAAFPDLAHRPHRIVAAGDEVAVELEVTGTHTQDLAAPDGNAIPPTGRPIRIGLAEFWRLRDGRVSEYRVYYDHFEFLTQLGLTN
ncbi:ester cyclase [Streptomyces sp. bgisy034]|uniref:ester cyclase n=1 Tax=Streptomyces sp. bgisy034 TaxID=3413774 RepID=UPI003EBAD520